MSHQGFRVKLFEANEKIGGCCANTQLQGCTFNDGAIYVAVSKILDKAFARLGLDRRSAVPLRRIVAKQTTRFPDGTIVSIGDGRDIQVHGANGNARTAWFNYTVPTNTVPELAPPGGGIIEMFPPIDQAWPIDRWTEEGKEAVAESAIMALSKIHKMDIAVKRVQSPVMLPIYQAARNGGLGLV